MAVHDHLLSSPLTDSRIDPGGQPGLQALSAWDAQQRAEYSSSPQPHVVDVFYHTGVTDTLAESVLAGAKMLGLTGLEHVETGRRYFLDSRLSETDVRAIVEALLYNPVIQQYTLRSKNEGVQFIAPPGPTETEQPQITQSIPICNMADQQLLELSQKGLLALNLEEIRAIQRYYREQGREPTDVELETLAQTWSEHCSHKTFKASIAYREVDNHGNVLADETINGLLKHYLMRATEQVKREWLVSAFSDNAGIIRFTGTQDIAFKVETHNHPSAIEPFGGANTGVGGVIRDVLGVSAQPYFFLLTKGVHVLLFMLLFSSYTHPYNWHITILPLVASMYVLGQQEKNMCDIQGTTDRTVPLFPKGLILETDPSVPWSARG